MIDYNKILIKNMKKVFVDVLKDIKKNGLSSGNHIYITFDTNHKKNIIPKWLKEKYPNEITIVIQYEYLNLQVEENYFSVDLSFNDIKTNLKIEYNSIISFSDPFANFGLKLKEGNKNKIKKINKNKKDNNIINFSNYKKTNLNNKN